MQEVIVNKKYCRTGMDTFEFVATLDGLEDVSFKEVTLPNKIGKSIVTIRCNAGRVSGSVNAVHFIRDTNEVPFGFLDSLKLECVRNNVFEFIQKHLKEKLNDRYMDKHFDDLRVTSLEVNITRPCVGKATASDMAHLFDMVFEKTKTYRRRKKGTKCEKEYETTIYEKKHEYEVKAYDKLSDLERQHDLPVKSDRIFRLEIVFKDRKLNAMFGKDNRTLETVFSIKALDIMCKEYKAVLEEIIDFHVKPYLNNCVETLVESMMKNEGGSAVSDTLCRYRDIIVDLECVRRALRKYYRKRDVPDITKQMIYKCRNKNLQIPEDVLKTLKVFREAAG